MTCLDAIGAVRKSDEFYIVTGGLRLNILRFFRCADNR